MKRIITVIICSFFIFNSFTEEKNIFTSKIEGTWLSKEEINFYYPDRKPNIVSIHKTNYKEIDDSTIIFLNNYYFDLPYFALNSWRPNVIIGIREVEDCLFSIEYNICEYKLDDEGRIDVPIITDEKYSLRVKFLDKDTIQVLDCGFDEKIWYRIDGPARIDPRKAQCNDNRVRIRLKPNLNCQTLGFLNKNDKVVIKDRSEEKYEIDGEKWYWYKVDFPTLPDGWVYGKYLDIEK